MTKIQPELKAAADATLERVILFENTRRLSIASLALIGLVFPLYFIQHRLFNTGPLILAFVAVSILLTPLIWLMRIQFERWPVWRIKAVQYLYSCVTIAYGCSLSFWSARQADMTHMFFMVIAGLVVLIVMHPRESFIIHGVSFVSFVLPLPIFMSNPDAVLATRINTTVFMMIIQSLSIELYQMRKRSYLDQLNIEKQNTQLKELVRLDPMTQLLNHEASFAALTEEIRRSRRMNIPLSILIMDLDDFKTINDTYGHLVGDHVIRQTADIIRQTVRITDQVGRYGREEFIVIMPDTDLAAASVVAARIRQALERADFDHSFKVTISGGISQFQLESIDELIRQTDSKLYQAKKTGKNRIIDSLAEI